MKITAIAILAGATLASKSDFPSNDWFHADCSFHVTFPDTTCDDLISRVFYVAGTFTPGPAKG